MRIDLRNAYTQRDKMDGNVRPIFYILAFIELRKVNSVENIDLVISIEQSFNYIHSHCIFGKFDKFVSA